MRIDLARLFAGGATRRITRIVAVDERGDDQRELPFERVGDTVSLATRAGDFKYRLEL